MNREQITKLKKLQVLLFDCQATHSNPTLGDVFEIGWLRARVSEACDRDSLPGIPESRLVQLPRKKELPRPVQKISGLDQEDFRASLSKRKAWFQLLKSARKTAEENGMDRCPTVIHYARYEEPFLRRWQQEFCPEEEFPFRIICTHRITKHLFPGLPRKGLRAVAGYFGSAVPDTRRSRFHVQATFLIWKHLIDSLEKDKNCSTLEELTEWLETSSFPSPAASGRDYPLTEENRRGLPDLPGVYRMFRSNGDLLYIGKAKSLRRRVTSYFNKRGKHSEHILEMLSQARSLTHSVTGTALEAALKESDEIKVLAPSYNISLRSTEEGPFFAAADLKNFVNRPDRLHNIGPLPSKKHIESLSSLLDSLNGSRNPLDPRIFAKILATSEEYIPDTDSFQKGIEEFKKINRDRLSSPMTLPSVMKLGTFLWKERLERLSEEDRESEEEEILVLKPEPTDKTKKSRKIRWSPETVAKALTSIVRTGVYMIRRSRWFYLLTESSLAWEGRGKGHGQKNLIFFVNGQAHPQTPIPLSTSIPHPPGWRKTREEKQKNFDLFTYDRMRIVNTEIRRLLKEDRSVELCLGPDFRLDSERLRKILQWV
jgi:DNA polymerase-3 subunit epsilon